MKKLFYSAVVAAVLAGCSKDIATDINNGSQNDTENYYGGIVVEATVTDVTRVTVGNDGTASLTAWEAGDEITIAYDGKAYVYVAQNSGRTSAFAPKDAENAITSIDPVQDVAAFYNVTTVDVDAKSAVFDIAAVQTEGTLSNKLPLYAYDASAQYADGKLVLTMNPLASILEFEVRSSADWHATTLSVAPAKGATISGFTSITGAKIDAKTGDVDTASATPATSEIKVDFAAAKNFNGSQNVQVVVGAVKFGGVGTGEGAVYAGGAVVKLYKDGNENFRRVIWMDEAKNVDLTTAYKHVYQPLADIMAGHRNGISTAEDMKAFADEVNGDTESYPVGVGFCNEDGVVVLNNTISLAAYDPWTPIANFKGIFEGNGKCIYNLHVAQTERYAGLFGVVRGTVCNLTCGSQDGTTYDGVSAIEEKYSTDTDTWCYAGVVAQIYGGELNNITNYMPITTTSDSKCKSRIGGISGSAYDAKVIGCNNYGEVRNAATTGNISYTGGLLGVIDGSNNDAKESLISDCHNHAKVSTTLCYKDSAIGGIAGLVIKTALNATVENCTNEGEVFYDNSTNSDVHNIAGIIGRSENSCPTLVVNACSNSGKVHSTMNGNCFMGGIMGSSQGAATIKDCVNTGEVSFEQTAAAGAGYISIGGICGQTYRSTIIIGCKNHATVKSNKLQVSRIGGIVGTHNDSSLTDSHNTGDVILDMGGVANNWEAAGGVVGFYDGTSAAVITSGCTNSGTVTARINTSNASVGAGGIVGLIKIGQIIGNTNSGNVSMYNVQAASYAGGVLGNVYSGAGVITDNINSGNVTAEAVGGSTALAAGGVVGYNQTGTVSGGYSTGSVNCALYAGAAIGWNKKNVSHIGVGGSVNGTVLTADNFGSLAIGSDAGTSEGITFKN